MKTVRKQVFETNSSSTHALCLSSDRSKTSTIPLDRNGEVVLRGGQFGWQWEKLSTPLEKANYLAVACVRFPDVLQKLIEVIKEETGASGVKVEFGLDYEDINWSYIDHQSYGVANDALSSKESMRDCIFNDASIIWLGSDNDYAPIGFYDLPEDISEYKYEVRLEGVTQVVFIKDLKEISRKEGDQYGRRIPSAIDQLWNYHILNQYGSHNGMAEIYSSMNAEGFDLDYEKGPVSEDLSKVFIARKVYDYKEKKYKTLAEKELVLSVKEI